MDSDFIVLNFCVGRPASWRKHLADFLCKYTGHLLWRTGSIVKVPNGSLPLNAVYCRRCFKGGYVNGDYFRKLDGK